MKTLFTVLLFAFLNLTAHAGQELDKFKQDVDAYLAAQAVNPAELIKYSDAEGHLVRAALAPNRVQKLVLSIYKDSIDDKLFDEYFEKFMTAVLKYAKIFRSDQGKYDAEYLDAFECLYHMTVTTAAQEAKLNISAEQISKLHKSSGIEASMSRLLLTNLEKDITDRKFSELYLPIAKLRLSKLQYLASK